MMQNPFNGIERLSALWVTRPTCSRIHSMELKAVTEVAPPTAPPEAPRIHSMELKDRSLASTGLQVLPRPWIHSMELKDRMRIVHYRVEAIVWESIQWNWKIAHPLNLRYHPALLESIQWNWKSWTVVWWSLELGLKNPFNGIERCLEHQSYLSCGDSLGIHSMELKDVAISPSSLVSSETMNPFNGIERLYYSLGGGIYR